MFNQSDPIFSIPIKLLVHSFSSQSESIVSHRYFKESIQKFHFSINADCRYTNYGSTLKYPLRTYRFV